MNNLKQKLDKIISNIECDSFTSDNLERLKRDINLVDILKAERSEYLNKLNRETDTEQQRHYNEVLNSFERLINLLNII